MIDFSYEASYVKFWVHSHAVFLNDSHFLVRNVFIQPRLFLRFKVLMDTDILIGIGTAVGAVAVAIFTAAFAPRQRNRTVRTMEVMIDEKTGQKNAEIEDLKQKLKKVEKARTSEIKGLREELEKMKDARTAEIEALSERLKKTEEARAAEIESLRKELNMAKEQAAWIQSIPPEITPTKEQFEEAKSMLKDPDGHFYHFAVAGYTGTGKSSLINALRGCNDTDDDAAKVDIVEATVDVNRYPDGSSALNKFVWYDIPGAGTQTNKQWQYFNNKKLFIFDFIIICWKDRITEIDMQILNSCKTWNIPTFLVRTNSRTQIRNLMLSNKLTEKEAIEELKVKTRATVEKNLKDGNYNEPNKKVYIIDRHILGNIISSATQALNSIKDLEDFTELHSIEDFTKLLSIEDYRIIINEGNVRITVNAESEINLLRDLLKTAKDRRK
ncbi:6079_t:CDS:1 [Paraglomus occultum]|uniref:6079_t:CDS:1 n=1 Tax=Paraglomus occultum TaxID=144539 RepID=A0A9N9C955_9GLOM|nr:6079_t:CDS:1 [Paraglomus occultum]